MEPSKVGEMVIRPARVRVRGHAAGEGACSGCVHIGGVIRARGRQREPSD